MATIVLSAVGAAAGASIGGSALGLSAVALGRAAGATVGRLVDQRLLGAGSSTVETGKVDRFRLSAASEGAPVAEIFGQTRVSGQVIWSSNFLETRTETSQSGGKGAGGSQTTISYSYSVSLAVALGVGEIVRVGRIWADGIEIAPKDLNFRVYKGREDQLVDPKIEAVEGVGNAPAYRGIAYVVIEDMPLELFGNRVPQLSFEVIRPARPKNAGVPQPLSEALQAVALVPGTGEYALATTPVHFDLGEGQVRSANVSSVVGKPDFVASMEALRDEGPNVKATSLVVSWFGNDLRAFACDLKPKVEQTLDDGVGMPWRVSGLSRASAEEIVQVDGRPIYGGTPTDQSVVEAIQDMRTAGQHVTFYPFILMEQLADNSLVNPWTGEAPQPELPWRGRITTSFAPGVTGSPDGTASASAEVAAFFGTAETDDFTTWGSTVGYNGPAEWSYRRFILHYAHLCAAAGGVNAFCIGSEMRSLTQIRGAGNSFPAVEALIALAADVRSILGPETKISYAADWSEYFGYHPQDGSGDVYFHLDPLWASPNIDFVGIDNYMPLSDWRDGDDHADVGFGAIYNPTYLEGNILGGEGYDWFYASEDERFSQRRTPIIDGAHGEDWVFRYKDLPNWWGSAHHERIAGVRLENQTAWIPQSKPIWFTEFGCAAIDKGTNEPNKFLDPKSSESALPRFSNGRRDDLIQAEYLRAMTGFWSDAQNNPISEIYGASMLDMSKAHVWAWDTRPFPAFPNNTVLWSDGGNYARGHWLNGRMGGQSLAGVVARVCESAGIADYDVSELFGYLRGYSQDDNATARQILQPLMLAYGFDVVEREGKLIFRSRDGRAVAVLDAATLAVSPEQGAEVEVSRAPDAEIAGRIRLNYTEANGDYEVRASEAIFPDERTTSVDQSDLPLVLTQSEGRQIVERWMAEARVAREQIRMSLPLSGLSLGAGDVVSLPDGGGTSHYRIDRVEQVGQQLLEGVRVERNIYVPADAPEETPLFRPFIPALPVFPVFLDLPLLRGTEVEHAPYMAVAATPWPGLAVVYSSPSGEGYTLNTRLEQPAAVGRTLNNLDRAAPDMVDRGPGLQVRFGDNLLSSAPMEDVLNGANAVAIGDGISDVWEIFQFTSATLVAPGAYELSNRLRGQLGTDGVIPDAWPAGSLVVVLNDALSQLELAASTRGLARYYRIGPGTRGVDDPAFVEEQRAFEGVGLRPYAPAHLSATENGGEQAIGWVRRTRIDGDSWQSVEVPLGEETEAYLVRITVGGSVVRETETAFPEWTYSVAQQTADGVVAPFDIEVAQISQRFGAGLYARMTWNG